MCILFFFPEKDIAKTFEELLHFLPSVVVFSIDLVYFYKLHQEQEILNILTENVETLIISCIGAYYGYPVTDKRLTVMAAEKIAHTLRKFCRSKALKAVNFDCGMCYDEYEWERENESLILKGLDINEPDEEEIALDKKSIQESNENVTLDKKSIQKSNENVTLDKKSIQESNESVTLDKKSIQESDENVTLDKKSIQESNESVTLDKKSIQESNENVTLDKKSIQELNENNVLDMDTAHFESAFEVIEGGIPYMDGERIGIAVAKIHKVDESWVDLQENLKAIEQARRQSQIQDTGNKPVGNLKALSLCINCFLDVGKYLPRCKTASRLSFVGSIIGNAPSYGKWHLG